MPRNMSFFYTQQQIRNRTKTVTRRLGWYNFKPGTVLNACEKCQGLKKGEKIVKMCKIRILNTRAEALSAITHADVAREGFPGMSTSAFIKMFTRHMKCKYYTIVNRIEFEYLK